MAGYSPNPLIKKLGFKHGSAALLLSVPDTLPDISAFPGFSSIETALAAGPRRFDAVHWFETSRARLEDQIHIAAGGLKPDAMLWMSWPKKASKTPTDITEDALREVILPLGLVDVKVCAVDDVWSGLKFMWRKELRSAL
jgi:hypothetical protein